MHTLLVVPQECVNIYSTRRIPFLQGPVSEISASGDATVFRIDRGAYTISQSIHNHSSKQPYLSLPIDYRIVPGSLPDPVVSVGVCYTAVYAAARGLTTGWWAVVLECFSSHPLLPCRAPFPKSPLREMRPFSAPTAAPSSSGGPRPPPGRPRGQLRPPQIRCGASRPCEHLTSALWLRPEGV